MAVVDVLQQPARNNPAQFKTATLRTVIGVPHVLDHPARKKSSKWLRLISTMLTVRTVSAQAARGTTRSERRFHKTVIHRSERLIPDHVRNADSSVLN